MSASESFKSATRRPPSTTTMTARDRVVQDQPSMSRRRVALLTGGAGATAFLLAWVEGPAELPAGAGGATTRRWVESNLGAVERHVLAETLAFAAVLVFVLGISWLMRHAEAPGRLLSDLAGLSGGLVAVWFWLQGSLDALPLVLTDDAGKLTAYSDQALVALEPLGRLGETFGDLATVPRGLLVLAVSLLALRTRFSPRWLAVLGLAVATLSLLGALLAGLIPALGGALVVALFGFFVWLLLLSAALLLSALRRPSPSQPLHPET